MPTNLVRKWNDFFRKQKIEENDEQNSKQIDE